MANQNSARQKATSQPRRKMSSANRTIYALLALALFGVFFSIFIQHLPGRPNPIIEKQPDVAMPAANAGVTVEQQQITAGIENNRIIVPLNVLLEKKFIAFDYQASNITIPLLASINNDGKLVTCIRMCEPCNSKTFRIEGTELTCGNCETHWKLGNLEGTQGSCQKYPLLPVPSSVVGNNIQIDVNDVRNWKMRI